MRIPPLLISLFVALAIVVPVRSMAAEAASAAPGAHGARMLSYQLGDGCVSSATVRTMTLVYIGTSSADIRHVYAKVGRRTVSRKFLINPEDLTVDLRFPRMAMLNVCQGGVIDVYADISRAAKVGSTHQLMVELESDVATDEDSVGVPTQGTPLTIITRKNGR